jgi:Secretion system C-terminal sorting domain
MKRPLPAKILLLAIILLSIPLQTVFPQAVIQSRLQRTTDFQAHVMDTLNAVNGPVAIPGSRVSMAAARENLSADKYKVYPVPAHGDLTVSGTDDVTLLEIYDVTGNKIISEDCKGESIKPLNISHLARGIYFIRLTTPRGAVMKRFIKE